MKVELQCGDTIAIPEGCKAVIKGGKVVFEKEQTFKDGDILTTAYPLYPDCPFIYKGTDEDNFHQFYIGVDCSGCIIISDYEDKRWGNGTLRYATEEEKQLLFDKMKEQGLRWNAEEKRVEKIRWRAKEGEHYSLLDRLTFKVDCYTEGFDEIDTKLYNSGNYFRTKEQAEEAAKRVKEVLHKFHEEIGE